MPIGRVRKQKHWRRSLASFLSDSKSFRSCRPGIGTFRQNLLSWGVSRQSRVNRRRAPLSPITTVNKHRSSHVAGEPTFHPRAKLAPEPPPTEDLPILEGQASSWPPQSGNYDPRTRQSASFHLWPKTGSSYRAALNRSPSPPEYGW